LLEETYSLLELENTGMLLANIVDEIHSLYEKTLAYTPGSSLLPQPTPNEVKPINIGSPLTVERQARGPPLSPWQVSMPPAASLYKKKIRKNYTV